MYLIRYFTSWQADGFSAVVDGFEQTIYDGKNVMFVVIFGKDGKIIVPFYNTVWKHKSPNPQKF